MVSEFLNLWISFLAGLFAPLGAVCVLPLYPGFLAYLAGQLGDKKGEELEERDLKKKVIMFGLIVSLGVLVSMFIVGLIFSKLLEKSLTGAIAVISPIAFGFLALISLLMIFNFDFSRFLPKKSTKIGKNPYWSSFVFGLFFGAIVLPCNPASLIVLFALSTTTMSFVVNLLNFTVFGLGMATPLLLFAFISAKWSQSILGWITRNKPNTKELQ